MMVKAVVLEVVKDKEIEEDTVIFKTVIRDFQTQMVKVLI